MSELFIIIQARMTSTRLPKKVLLPLCGKTVLEVMLERLKKWKDNIIIATTDDGSEVPIVELCEHINMPYFKGSITNVLSRYYQTAKKFGAKKDDIIIRLTSDCPLIDASVLEKTLDFYKQGHYDYVSNRRNQTFPIGLDVEVFSFKVLQEAYQKATTAYEKEHVTPYLYVSEKEHYKIGSYKDSSDNSRYRLTLDEEDDYKAIKEVYKLFNNQTDFSYHDLINMLEENPYIYKINQNVAQK